MNTEQATNDTRYRPLAPHMRPHYKSRSDLRLLSRAYRSGWVAEVPIERQQDWVDDITSALAEDKPTHVKIAAIRAFTAILIFEGRARAQTTQPMRRRPRGPPRKPRPVRSE